MELVCELDRSVVGGDAGHGGDSRLLFVRDWWSEYNIRRIRS